jgi:hypothetical protein
MTSSLFGTLRVVSNKETRHRVRWFRINSVAFGNFKDQVTRTASRQAAQKTRKKQARNTGKLAAFDQISTVRPMK